MQVSVVLLRHAGMRLRPSELAPELVGDLRIGDAGATSFKRPLLVAQLWQATHSMTARPYGRPLFDPTILCMDEGSFSLLGIELATIDGRLREYAQVWRCEVAAKDR